MGRGELIDYVKRKRNTGKLLLGFMLVMALLTFFSNTINNFMLPRVVLESPVRGALIKEISGEGTIEAKLVHEEYSDTGLKVLEVNAESGDTVKKGQPIMRLDIDDLKSSLLDERNKYRQLQLSLEKLKDEGSLRSYGRSIESARDKLEKATGEYQAVKTLYDAGFESESKLKDAELEMNNAQRNYDSAVQDKEEYTGNRLRDIENTELNLEMQGRKITKLEKEVAKSGVYTAPEDGILTELNFSKGTITNNSKPLFRLAVASEGYELSIPVDSELAAYVKPGEKVEVLISALEEGRAEGSIAQVKDDLEDADRKDIVIDVKSDGLKGGEKGEVYISKKLEQQQTLVPNSAVYTDSEGSYVFTIKKADSPLGEESYVQRTAVTVIDSDSSKSAVTGIMSMDKVITGSTKPLSDADRVVVEQ